MSVAATVDALLRPLRRRIDNLVARAVVTLVTDGAKMQTVQLAVLTEETRESCERFQPYGLTSVPLPGAEAVVVFVQGLRDHPLVVAVDDRRYRKKPLQAGEVALYNDQSIYLLLRQNSTIEANAPIDLIGAAVYRVDGDQVVGPRGAAVADSTATAASVSTQLNMLLARLRTHGLIAS